MDYCSTGQLQSKNNVIIIILDINDEYVVTTWEICFCLIPIYLLRKHVYSALNVPLHLTKSTHVISKQCIS